MTPVPDTLQEHEADRQGSPNLPLAGSQRALGAYYTPDELADALTQWALAERPESILDPSFGGCAFLEAAATRLLDYTFEPPSAALFGVDIDPGCLDYVRQSPHLRETNFVVGDFLAQPPEKLPGAPYEAVIGNPPFVRHHWLKGPHREAARKAVAASTFDLPETASSWAYFVLHSLRCLRKGGRLAMLVPEALLQADYGQHVRNAISSSFGSACFIRIGTRFFADTDEAVVAVAASNFGSQCEPTVHAVDDLAELERVLSEPSGREALNSSANPRGRLVARDAHRLLAELLDDNRVSTLGDFATVRIGFVTGANQHFLLTQEEVRQRQLPNQALVPIVARAAFLRGLEFRSEMHRQLSAKKDRAYLVLPTADSAESDAIQEWIREGEASGLHTGYKCRSRSPWYEVHLSGAPDAFLTTTRLGPPVLTINRPGYHCSNALYGVYWKKGITHQPEAICVALLTTLVSLWAELEGRSYGGGALKVSVRESASLPLPVGEAAAESFKHVHSLLAQGRETAARRLADEVLLRTHLGLTASDVRCLREAATDLAERRRPRRAVELR